MILVTGATGFIGRHFLKKMNGSGHKIRVLSRDSSTDLNALDGIEVVNGSVDDPVVLDRFVVPDATVVNLAHANVISSAEAISATWLRNVQKMALKGSYTAVPFLYMAPSPDMSMSIPYAGQEMTMFSSNTQSNRLCNSIFRIVSSA